MYGRKSEDAMEDERVLKSYFNGIEAPQWYNRFRGRAVKERYLCGPIVQQSQIVNRKS